MTYSFTIVLDGVDCIDDVMEERLYSLCNDALLSSSNGEVRLDFGREASSRLNAISSAIKDICAAGYSVKLIEENK